MSTILLGRTAEAFALYAALFVGWAVWLRRRIPCLARHRWLVPLAIAMALATQILGYLTHDGPDWAVQAHGVVNLATFALGTAAPFVVALELALWAGGRLRRRRERLARVEPDDDPVAPAVTRRDALARIGGGTVVAATSLPVAWGAFRTRFDVEAIELAVPIARLPRVLDGLSIVQVSDTHIGGLFGERELRRVEDIVERLRPDLVVMTGDLVHTQIAYAPMAAAWVARLGARARFGAAAIPGNHEYYTGRDEVLGALRAAGVDVLFNAGRVVAKNDAGGFALVGVDDFFGPYSGRGPGPQVAGALSKLPPDLARVLLCHQPQYFPRAAAFGFDLMLSGHTHGGQIAPVGQIFSARKFDYVAGLYERDGARLYVNRGLGTTGVPSRVAVRPEVTKLVLVAA